MTHPLQAGFSKIDITPPLDRIEAYGIGYWYQRNVRFAGVRDPLFVRTLVIGLGGSRQVVASVDSIFDSYGFIDRATAQIAKTLAVPAANIFITCTHTHSSPLIDRNNTRKGSEYGVFVAERIVESAVTAALKTTDAHVAKATAAIENVLYNRRPLLSDGRIAELHQPITEATVVDPGPVNNCMTLVSFRDRAGTRIGGLCHFGIHGVSVQCSDLLSSDCFGRAIQSVEGGGDVSVLLHLNGPCGDIDPVLMGDDDALDSMTARLTTGLRDVLNAPELPVQITEMNAFGNTFHAVRRSTRSQSALEAARQALSNEAASSTSTRHHSGVGYESFLLAEETALSALPAEIPVRYQLLQWGTLMVAGIGGEVFTASGLAVQASCPGFTVLPVGLTGGAAGYLPLREMYVQGGYEVACAQWCPIAPGEPERLFAQIESDLQRVAKGRAA